jgi:hypothetical protein
MRLCSCCNRANSSVQRMRRSSAALERHRAEEAEGAATGFGNVVTCWTQCLEGFSTALRNAT